MAGNDQYADMTRERRAVWDGFTNLMLYTGISIVIILALMAVFVV